MKRATWVLVGVVLVAAVALTTYLVGRDSGESEAGPFPMVAPCDKSEGAPQVKPTQITLTCADANMSLESLTWSAWTVKSADGLGVLTENDCTPDCADGTDQHYPVKVHLTKTSGGASPLFLRLDLSFPGAAPPAGGTNTFELPSS